MARDVQQRCAATSKTGKFCRNQPSFIAAARAGSIGADMFVCGTHANSLFLTGWKISDYDRPQS